MAAPAARGTPVRETYEQIAGQCRELAQQYTQAWIEGRYDTMYALLDDVSKSLLSEADLKEEVERRALLEGSPVRVAETGAPYVGLSYVSAVEIPTGYAEERRVEWPAADRDRGIGPRGYGYRALLLVREDGTWRVSRDVSPLSRLIKQRPAHRASEWQRLGFPDRVASQLEAGVSPVPKGLSESPNPWTVAAAEYLSAWIGRDYKTMWAMLSQQARARTGASFDEFQRREQQNARVVKPLFVAETRHVEFLMDIVLEERGGRYFQEKLHIGPEDLHRFPWYLAFVRQQDGWRVQHEAALRHWQHNYLRPYQARPPEEAHNEPAQSQGQANSGECAASMAGGASGQGHGGACCPGSSDTKAKGESQEQTGSAVCGCGCSSSK